MKRFAPTLSGTARSCDAPLRAAFLPAVLLVILGLALMAGCGKDEANVTFPQPWEETPYYWYYDVYGTSATDIWVVGNLGMAYHYNGTDWRREDNLGTGKALTALYEASDGSIYAAGFDGTILRNSGGGRGGWSSMSSRTSENLLGLGSYQGALHAVGQNGAALRYDGGSWNQLPGTMVTRNPKEGNAVVDTLYLGEDVVSLKVVNHYMIGGSFMRPDYPIEPEPQGLEGTVGFYFKDDTPIVCDPPECDPAVDETGLYDWLITSLGDDPLATPEWIICGLSDDTPGAGIPNNWFGTSTGWLFRLTEDELTGTLNWIRYSLLPVTREERHGVRDLWMAANNDIYIVTDDGLVVHQADDGTRTTIYDQLEPLVSVWGTGPDNLYVTGYMDETILNISYDPAAPVDANNPVVTPITLEFPDKAMAAASGFDELGRPRN